MTGTSIHLCREYDEPADRMWARIGDFAGIDAWQPVVERSTALDGDRREVIVAGTGERFVEVLADHGDRHYGYRIVEGPAYVTNYRSTLRVRPLSPERCLVTWDSSFEPGELTASAGAELFHGFLVAGLNALETEVRAAEASSP
jgi:hypothetical protein